MAPGAPQGEHAAEEGHLPAQRGQPHRGQHDRLGHLRVAQGRADLQLVLRPVPGHLGHGRSVLCGGRPLLRRAGHHHHQVGRVLRLHPGGLRRLRGVHPAVDVAAHHRAHQPGGHRHHLRQLPGAATVPHLRAALRRLCELRSTAVFTPGLLVP